MVTRRWSDVRPSLAGATLVGSFGATTGYVATRLVAAGVTAPDAWLATLAVALLTTGSLFAVAGLFGGLLVARVVHTAHAPAPRQR
ncbi:hypothetical protein DM867_02230 [Halosegnis rubeus]|jgi:hypothetical protein|uniref:Uncharacterized protein n=1 Tax=Halosegnis rubeus TaxID=2212850 RepID=A0A5N5UDI8_9EURY|nr:hypothetical protein [Halosegnis rubeus]KAB7515983.1 hypothetical protein DM867_02230 [Halosegnis rubeus]KAB7516804.1 hypothetical protein DMP03_05420 [Halosegnis rubeus]KAB7520069.1 hypothetical protein DP108_02115 [Halosegnis rubeus]